MDTVLRHIIGFTSKELAFLQAARFHSAERTFFLDAINESYRSNYTSTDISTAAIPGIDAIGKYHATDSPPSGDGPVDIPPLRVVLSVLPLPFIALLSINARLGLHNKLALGAVRCATQLSVLGYVLVPIFIANKAWLTALYAMIMLLVAAAEAVSRPSQSYDGMLPEVFLAMGLACAASITFGLAAVVQVTPWYDAQYLIPMLGMLLGNSCSSVAVGLSAVLEEFSAGKEKVEALLALGATRSEATRDVVQRAARLALTPLLNSMNVVGIVSIPGMMTGQILGGSDPSIASRYQIVIYFLVAISSSLSAIATIYGVVFTICDGKHRLRSEKLKNRGPTKSTGAISWMKDQFIEGFRQIKHGMYRIKQRFGRLMEPQQAAVRGRRRYFTFRESRSSSSLEQTTEGNNNNGSSSNNGNQEQPDDVERNSLSRPLLASERQSGVL